MTSSRDRRRELPPGSARDRGRWARRRWAGVLWAALAAALPLSSLAAAGDAPPATRKAPVTEGRPWLQARSWLYQLQRIRLAPLIRSDYDLFVIDYSRNGRDEGAFTRQEIQRLKTAGGRRRLVVAYLSIGEAEPYRFYWKPGWKPGQPAWVDTPNPDWPDNYRVRFWHPAWQKILFGSAGSYVDRIMTAGFDGVYLDIVDGFQRYEEDRPAARQEMIDLVEAIARYCRRTRGDADFGVFAQNAVELLEDRAYVDILTGLGKEETYFAATNEPTGEEDRAWEESLLDRLVQRRRLVLCVDYVTTPRGVATTRRRCRLHGYLSLCTTVDLDGLPHR